MKMYVQLNMGILWDFFNVMLLFRGVQVGNILSNNIFPVGPCASNDNVQDRHGHDSIWHLYFFRNLLIGTI